MRRTMLRRWAGAGLLLLAAVRGTTACGALDVSDPTRIEDDELDNAAGAEVVRAGVLRLLATAVGTSALMGGLASDELFADRPSFVDVWPEQFVDQRESVRFEETGVDFGTDAYGHWQQVRVAAAIAIPRTRAFSVPARVGEMHALRGFAALRLAEDICPGFPLRDVVDLEPVYGPPLSTDQALEQAVVEFDAALQLATDSVRILDLARVGKARALVGLGRFAEAGVVAAAVSPTYVAETRHRRTAVPNPVLTNLGGFFLVRSVADREGGTGLDFATAGDPRVVPTLAGTALDGVTPIYGVHKYPDDAAPIVFASGLEAKLIEAEAALHTGQPAWLTILNDLRATRITPALPPLADPGTRDAQVDLLFRERAFWLFATGHRLGDLRRLISRYGRQAEQVFPTGPYRLGGAYETATSIPFSPLVESPFNPAVTGCTSR